MHWKDINSHFSDGYDALFKSKHSLAIVVKKIAAPRGVDINGICSSLSPVDGPLGSECYQKKNLKIINILAFSKSMKMLYLYLKLKVPFIFFFVSLEYQIILNSSQSWKSSPTSFMYSDRLVLNYLHEVRFNLWHCVLFDVRTLTKLQRQVLERQIKEEDLEEWNNITLKFVAVSIIVFLPSVQNFAAVIIHS